MSAPRTVTTTDTIGRLRGARRALVVGTWASAAIWGLVAATAVVLLALLVERVVRLEARQVLGAGALALLAGAVTVAIRLRRGARPSLVDAALWLEAREPALGYSLVTVADLDARRQAAAPALVAAAGAGRWPTIARQAAARAIAVPAGVLLCVGLAALFAAVYLHADVVAPVAGRAGLASTTEPVPVPVSQVTTFYADVQPPAYTGIRGQVLASPSTITALAGSQITVRGDGTPARSTVMIAIGEARPTEATWREGTWGHVFAMPARTVALRLSDDRASRVVVLESVRDSAPAVSLGLPARDTVLRAAVGRIALVASATDDFGLASAGFEYIVSSGEGESFTFKSGVLGAVAPRGRSVSLAASLDVAALGLKPGDLVHVRAVARDRNTVSGPSLGTSETRTIRVMRAGEADSVAVEAAAPADADRSVVSQRMLLLLTEALEKRRPTIGRPVLLDEAHRISVDQTRLRKSVGEIVFSRLGGQPSGEESSGDDTRPRSPDEVLRAAEAATNSSAAATDFEGDETPVVAVNRPLLEAYNAMWDAGRALDAGEPARAIPPMRAALAAIQRARQAERIYLRGRPPAVVVDVARARLQGKEPGKGSERTARPPADPGAALRATRFVNAVAALGTSPADGLDSLQLLRVDALDAAPRAAAALAEAIERLRSGRDATDALVRARRLLDGGAAPAPAGAWSGAW